MASLQRRMPSEALAKEGLPLWIQPAHLALQASDGTAIHRLLGVQSKPQTPQRRMPTGIRSDLRARRMISTTLDFLRSPSLALIPPPPRCTPLAIDVDNTCPTPAAPNLGGCAIRNVYHVYLIESTSWPAVRYIGFSENLRRRLTEHNDGKLPSTARHRPWRLQTYLAFSSQRQAFAFERYLKSGSGHAFSKRRLWPSPIASSNARQPHRESARAPSTLPTRLKYPCDRSISGASSQRYDSSASP